VFKFLTKITEIFRNGRPAQGGLMSRRTREWKRSPGANIDGTPMVGRTDIRGRSYGSVRGYGSRRY
jgi:hypothetical protein